MQNELELYKKLSDLRCFTRKQLITLCGSSNNAAWWLRKFLCKGYVERVHRDLYAVISLETSQPIPTRFQIASSAAKDACISYHSAFEYYGFANQVFYELFFSTEKRLRPFSFDGIFFQPLSQLGSEGIMHMDDGVTVTSLERTVTDCVANLERSGGLEEFLRCLLLIPSLSADRLLSVLNMYDYGSLYQKMGYLLEIFQEELGIPDTLLHECERHLPSSKTYFSSEKSNFRFYKRWKLYAPENLRSMIGEGNEDIEI